MGPPRRLLAEDIHRRKLECRVDFARLDYVHFYNHLRTHTALGGKTPMDALVNKVGGNYT